MGIGNWIKEKWETVTGEKTLRTTREYLDAAVGRIENLEKGFDFLRQNAVVRDEFIGLSRKFRFVAGIAWGSMALAVLSSAGVVYLLLHQTAR
jgi:hypothetical protein